MPASRLVVIAAAAAALALGAEASLPALAAGKHKDAKPAATDTAQGTAKNADPVIASVNGQDIHLSDVRAAAQGLPDEMRNLPPQMLFPLVVNQLIDQKALVDEARAEGLQKDPKVQQMIRQAEDTALQNALLSRAVTPLITNDKLQAAYQAQYANKQGEPEVHARHILVATEAQADDVIKQLKAGADFATLAKKVSTDKETAQANGGDLGWFKKGDMLPEFSNAAFSMKKGEISAQPVHTRYGWHVIQVLDTRVSPPPSFDSVKDQLRQGIIQAAVRKEVSQATAKVKIVRYNPDGTVEKPTPSKAVPGTPTQLPAPASPGPGTTPPSNE